MSEPAPSSIFFGLNKTQLERLFASGNYLELEKDTVFIQEGTKEKTFYFIVEGTVAITKNSGRKEHILTQVPKGETVGELALVDDAPRSASVKCMDSCKLYQFDINKLKDNTELLEIFKYMSSKLGQQLSNRLRYINDVTVSALKDKFAMSIFSIRVLIILSVYALSLSFIEKSKKFLPSTTVLSLVLILIFAAVMISIIQQSGYPKSKYGLTLNNAAKNFYEGILFSIPIMALIVLIKWLVISNVASLSHFPLFDPAAMFKQGVSFNLTIYILSMIAYGIFCPIQEFICRGCIQTSFQSLIDGSANKIKWEAIFISNLLFASAHAHTSTGFALATFIPGFFWGWLYYRQKSLVGVSISHILIGIWAAFIVGFQNMV